MRTRDININNKRNTILEVVAIVLLMCLASEIWGWFNYFESRKQWLENIGGMIGYAFAFTKSIVVPEFFSILIFRWLIINYQQRFLNHRSIGSVIDFLSYQLKLLPLFFVAYYIFAPVTFSIRFILNHITNLSVDIFVNKYLHNYLSFSVYLTYLPFVIITGLVISNGRLISEIFNSSDTTPAYNSTTVSEVIAEVPTIITEKRYWQTLKVSNGSQEYAVVSVDNIRFFEFADRVLQVNHVDGYFRASQTIHALENNLDPTFFFRPNRNVIINLKYLKSFHFIGKNKYILTIENVNASVSEFPMQQAHITDLRQAFETYKKLSLREQIQDGHSDSDPIFNLVKYNRVA
jgi:LytTr DNA-binding domain